MTSLTIPENISPQAEAWKRSQLGKSRVELAVERVLAIRVISAVCWEAYSLLSESQRERLLHWLGE